MAIKADTRSLDNGSNKPSLPTLKPLDPQQSQRYGEVPNFGGEQVLPNRDRAAQQIGGFKFWVQGSGI